MRLPAARNGGRTYRDRITAADLERLGPAPGVVAFLADRYGHSSAAVWRERIAAGELLQNGQQLRADGVLQPGDRLVWHRPPWEEAAVPGSWGVRFDDGDLYVLDKPSGLPVLPAGGFSEHTLLRLLETRHSGDPAGVPRPVHRLGRHTSGLLVCARRPATRAWLSALLRDPEPGGGCRKIYRALTAPLPAALAEGESLVIRTPIARRPHSLLGTLWAAAPAGPAAAAEGATDSMVVLEAHSRLTLRRRLPEACLVDVEIATGRPHQIRIHTAAIGAPLQGDPLYLPGGQARPDGLPGAGGYHLHAHRLQVPRPEGGLWEWEAPPPPELRLPGESGCDLASTGGAAGSPCSIPSDPAG
ncbi:MAG: RluA family pseudouridine synthase [Synechococcus sp.]